MRLQGDEFYGINKQRGSLVFGWAFNINWTWKLVLSHKEISALLSGLRSRLKRISPILIPLFGTFACAATISRDNLIRTLRPFRPSFRIVAAKFSDDDRMMIKHMSTYLQALLVRSTESGHMPHRCHGPPKWRSLRPLRKRLCSLGSSGELLFGPSDHSWPEIWGIRPILDSKNLKQNQKSQLSKRITVKIIRIQLMLG